MRHATRRRRVRRFLMEGLGWIAVVAMATVGGAAEADALPNAVNLIPDFQKQGLIPWPKGTGTIVRSSPSPELRSSNVLGTPRRPTAGFRKSS